MKKIVVIVSCMIFLGFISANAQEDGKVKKVAKSTGHAVGKAAKKVGNKTAEVASKGTAKVKDKTYKDKVGPDGQTIYIDDHSRYYWIDKKGHRNYVKETDLRAKEG